MMMPKIFLCLALGVALAGPAAAQPAADRADAVAARERARAERRMSYQPGGEEQTDRQTRSLKLGPDGELSLHNIAGDIVVTKSGGNDATIEIVKTARGRTVDEARAMLERVEVSIVERDGRTEVRAVYRRGERGDPLPGERDDRGGRGRRPQVSVAYTVAAPARTRLSIGSVSGNVRVTDIRGDVSVNSVSGGVHIANAGRVAEAQSVSGNVEVLDSQLDGALEAQSVSGNVTVRKVQARRVEAGSVSGSVLLQDLQSDRIEANSISGGIEFGGPLAKAGRYEFSTHSGNARIVVAGGGGFELEARSFSGTVRSDLPLKGQTRDREDGPGRGHALNGTHGDGSAVLSITTFSGDVTIARR